MPPPPPQAQKLKKSPDRIGLILRQHTFKQKRAGTFDKISLHLMAELARMQIHLLASDFDLRTFARKTFTIQIFFIFWLQSDNELPMSELEKNWGVTDFVFEIKRVKNSPNFDKSDLVTRHGVSAC